MITTRRNVFRRLAPCKELASWQKRTPTTRTYTKNYVVSSLEVHAHLSYSYVFAICARSRRSLYFSLERHSCRPAMCDVVSVFTQDVKLVPFEIELKK